MLIVFHYMKLTNWIW